MKLSYLKEQKLSQCHIEPYFPLLVFADIYLFIISKCVQKVCIAP